MRSLITMLVLVASLIVTTDAVSADRKEIEQAVKAEYRLTKRNIFTGQAKSPGTVVYVRREGLRGLRPVAAVPETIVESGEIIVPSSGPLPLPMGEEMHIYSVRSGKDWVRLLLGTVRSYEAPGVLDSTVYQPFQLALKFSYPEGVSAVSTDRVLSDFERFLSKEPVANSEQVVAENASDSPQPSYGEQQGAPSTTARQQADSGPQQNQGNRQSDGRSMKGLEPVGPIDKPGCEGLEVIGYAQTQFGTGQYFYYVAIRNNTSVTKLVGVRHIGGRTVHGQNREGSGDITVKAGDIKKYEIDLSVNPPVLFEVQRCL